MVENYLNKEDNEYKDEIDYYNCCKDAEEIHDLYNMFDDLIHNFS